MLCTVLEVPLTFLCQPEYMGLRMKGESESISYHYYPFTTLFPHCISNYGLGVLIPKGGMPLSADTIMFPLNGELKIASRCFGLFVLLNWPVKKRIQISPRGYRVGGFTVGAGRTVFGILSDRDCSFLCRKRWECLGLYEALLGVPWFV